MVRGVSRGVGVLVAAALVGACAGSGSEGSEDASPPNGAAGGEEAAAPDLEVFEGDDFYAVPNPLPDGEHGDLIRYEVIDEVAVEGATRYRIMYLSESVPGDPIAVTGTAVVPDGEASDQGRDILTLAHGTAGIADECAPSKNVGPGEGTLADAAVDAGYLLADTDYEGLGTPGRHPYLVGESEGRGVLDAARAATQLPDADAGTRMAIAGYSQGGHGALWAGQLAADWTPELDLVGTFAGAPASELGIIIGAAHSLPIAGFLYMIIAGFEASYPDQADPSLLLTLAGLDALDNVDEGCTGEVVDSVAGLPSSDLIKPDPGSVEPWATLAEQNDPGRVRTDSPILIIHSSADEVVPASLSEIMHGRMCEVGQQVERRVVDDGGHGQAAPQAFAEGLEWIAERFAGEPAASSCP
jgi:pimeloyl-ACP methyl ester carboxylesterase